MDHRRALRSPFRLFIGRACIGGVLGALLPATSGGQAASTRLAEKTVTASVSSLRDSLVAFARAQLGVRYRYGGESPARGFDCSGLVKFVLARFDLDVPRTARQQASVGVVVERDTSQLRPGDLLLFSARDRGPVSHIGIYVGNGRFIHASSAAKRVIETPLDRPPAPRIKLWRGARRNPVVVDDVPVDVLAAPER